MQTLERPAEPALDRLRRVIPWSTLATDDWSRGVYRVPVEQAARMREIALDPPGWVTALRFDVDRADAATAWIDAGLPRPNIIVRRPQNGHAHYIYLLAAWVEIDPAKRATRWLAAIERAMTAALGADPRYAGRLVHNPLADHAWNVNVARDEPYTLAELHAHVDMHVPAQPTWTRTDSGIGRNVDLFDRLRLWAYRKASAGDLPATIDGWRAEAAIEAARRNTFAQEGHPRGDLPAAEVSAIAKSVAMWVWTHYDPDPAANRRRRDRERERQAARERSRHRSTMTRAQYTARAAERRSTAVELRSGGLSVREIAARQGCSVREVYRLLAGLIAEPVSVVSASPATAPPTPPPPAPSTVCRVRPPNQDFAGAGAPRYGLAYVLARCRELAEQHPSGPPYDPRAG